MKNIGMWILLAIFSIAHAQRVVVDKTINHQFASRIECVTKTVSFIGGVQRDYLKLYGAHTARLPALFAIDFEVELYSKPFEVGKCQEHFDDLRKKYPEDFYSTAFPDSEHSYEYVNYINLEISKKVLAGAYFIDDLFTGEECVHYLSEDYTIKAWGLEFSTNRHKVSSGTLIVIKSEPMSASCGSNLQPI